MDSRKRKRHESTQWSDFKPTSNEFTGDNCSTCLRRPYRGRQPNDFQNCTPSTSHDSKSSNINPVINNPTHFHSLVVLYQLYKKNSREIIKELIKNQEQFSELLESNLEPGWIVLTLAILSKVCSSSFKENKIDIINLAAKSSFTETVVKYVANLPNEDAKTRIKNNYFWICPDAFFSNLVDVCASLIETIPTKASEVLQKLLQVVDVIPTLEEQRRIRVSETTKSRMTTLIDKLKENESLVLPPDDFRTLSVYPTAEEILSPNPAFVRKNIIQGRYTDVEHYLDVQFRLLREYFVASLRQGIAEYFDQPQGVQRMQFDNVNVHRDVVFHSLIFEKERVGVILKFSNQDASDRVFSPDYTSLNYGSLVCFTKNNFRSVLFGKVLDRDCNEKKLIISFETEYHDYEFNIPYLMVECKIYFEPYYHVLQALKCMSEINFPMKKYLIDVDPSVERPGYLDEGSSVFTIQDQSVDLFGNGWPSADDVQLNSSQYSAFKAALTQKFVVIQGPPGTGKTYVGLKIVQTLLQEDNRRFWFNGTPILVVCFTNHALDQFLLGLTSTTGDIVRVGEQSKCEELNCYNLASIRANFKINNKREKYTWRREMEILLNKLQKYNQRLKQIKTYKYIINFRHFDVIDEQIANSWFLDASSLEMMSWLLTDRRYYKDIQFNSNLIQPSETIEDENEEERNPFNNCNELHNENISDQFDDDLFNVSSEHNLTVLVCHHDMCVTIAENRNELQNMECDTQQQMDLDKKSELEAYFTELMEIFQYFKMRMRDGEISPAPMKPRDVNYQDPDLMHPNDRWDLYFNWINLYQQHIVAKLVELQNEYQEVYKKYTDARSILDTEIMKNHLVVGMTTTGAARLQKTLQNLKCPIVVVEEAAEVLESHVTVSLTSHCQHLILIGDHQQLRPTTEDHRLKTEFNLGISMFERMVRNNIQCHTLDVQHRMRPEIANLIVPHVYPQLENHNSVSSFPPILGMASPLFFIHHDHEECEEFNSISNLHEAKFLTNLACYLRQSGYNPEDITILVAYSGQFFVMRDEVKKHEELLDGIRIRVLDGYQGEECKIILLSLVRNNREGKIGFLKIENRVCVALSRAREGLYIMGNINLLCQNSEIWPKIKEELVRQNRFGNYLPVHCENHRDLVTKIRDPEDFEHVAPGNCKEKCGSLLKCGHQCPKTCHIVDNSDHKTDRCEGKCLRAICDDRHACPKMCYQSCDTCTVQVTRQMDCGHEVVLPCNADLTTIQCKIPVTAMLPCGHKVLNKPCYEDRYTFKCTQKCNSRIRRCGHSCDLPCHINVDLDHLDTHRCRKLCKKIALDCTTKEHICQGMCSGKCYPCKVMVKKNFPNCSHMRYVYCSTDMNLVSCMELCQKRLPCLHMCPKRCYEACGDCPKRVWKIKARGREVMAGCYDTPEKRFDIDECPRQLKCNHPCKNGREENCTNKGLQLVELTDKAACGHIFKVECHMLGTSKLPSDDVRLLQFCREPCSQILECSHKCSGSCGACFQGRLHLACSEKCELTLICGHRCQSLCGDVCQPCNEGCSAKCLHTNCNLRCGEVCRKCNKPCSRKCKHKKCKAKCWDICTVDPCQEPCEKLLKCAHPCVGFCGDPCPPLCRICDKELLTEVFLGYENETEARFVLLDECKHVIESRGLDIYFKQENTENGDLIECKRCPRCQTSLASTQRYREYIKETKFDAVNVQYTAHGEFFERNEKAKNLVLALDNFQTKFIVKVPERKLAIEKILKVLLAFSTFLIVEQRSFNLFIGKIMETVISIFETIHKMDFQKLTPNNQLKIETYWNHIITVKFLTIKDIRFTNQVILDLEREICRLQRIEQLFNITTDSTDLSETEEFIFRPIPYTKEFDDEMKAKLEGFCSKLGKEVPEMKYGEILRDLRLKKPRWFYCREGHYYMDFGEPNQVAKCEQCGE